MLVVLLIYSEHVSTGFPLPVYFHIPVSIQELQWAAQNSSRKGSNVNTKPSAPGKSVNREISSSSLWHLSVVIILGCAARACTFTQMAQFQQGSLYRRQSQKFQISTASCDLKTFSPPPSMLALQLYPRQDYLKCIHLTPR